MVCYNSLLNLFQDSEQILMIILLLQELYFSKLIESLLLVSYRWVNSFVLNERIISLLIFDLLWIKSNTKIHCLKVIRFWISKISLDLCKSKVGVLQLIFNIIFMNLFWIIWSLWMRNLGKLLKTSIPYTRQLTTSNSTILAHYLEFL